MSASDGHTYNHEDMLNWFKGHNKVFCFTCGQAFRVKCAIDPALESDMGGRFEPPAAAAAAAAVGCSGGGAVG